MAARVLVVDGSNTDRAMVVALLAGSGCEVDQAPDGIEAFESLLAQSYDLVVSEAHLERLDTPELIAKLRCHGVKAPILVLTSITKTATLGALMKLGIADYVPKALPPEAIRQKLTALLPVSVAAAPPAPSAPAVEAPAAESRPMPVGGSALLIDEAEVEHQRLRALLPSAVAIDGCKTFNEGLARARHGHYRMLLVDTDSALLNLGGLISQMRALQPEAAVVALVTLGKHDECAAVRTSLEPLGFDEVVFKPMTADRMTTLAERYCTAWDDLVTTEDDVIAVSRLHYRREQRDRYLHELPARIEAALRVQSDACFDRVILDLTRAEQIAASEAVEMIARVDGVAGTLGVTLLVVVASALGASLHDFEESFRGGAFRWFASAAAARAAAGN